ncbi:MAG TPA: PfkB family carbohydrate kinase [Candidatus Binatia bacterium]|jgi:sugar/nucleoside kinase (ribokinase family)|nr:PfkB family carbohydrate kinase [Candidatus Binatia bacterium]
MSILVVGSVAFDTIETPYGRVEEVLGGSAAYFAVAASYFAPVKLVAAVGEDFPVPERAFLASRDIDLSGLTVSKGRTFRWTGRYHEDMNVRDTLDLQLNVFADFSPQLPAGFRDAPFVFLANINPGLQGGVLDQLTCPRLIACDTISHWIAGARPELEALLKKVDILVINDEEARLLSGERNMVRAARKILGSGPRTLLVKRGEYGVLLFSPDSIFAVPAYPLEEVFDPTGAGDSFAGGFLGYLAQSGDLSEAGFRKAIVYGSVVASFVVEDFSLRRLRTLTRDDIERRYRQFVSLTEF